MLLLRSNSKKSLIIYSYLLLRIFNISNQVGDIYYILRSTRIVVNQSFIYPLIVEIIHFIIVIIKQFTIVKEEKISDISDIFVECSINFIIVFYNTTYSSMIIVLMTMIML